MAQFTAQGGLKLFFNGKGVSFRFDSNDPFHYKGAGRIRFVDARPIQPHNNNTRSYRSSRVFSSLGKKPSGFSTEERLVADDGGEVDLGFDEDDQFENDELSCFRGLVLDISYRPINVVCWRRAICLEFMEKADVLEYYDQTVNSPSGSFYIPAVLRVPHLLQVVKRRRIKQHLSRKNIFFRDMFTCQYCSSRENLTIDHVLPVSKGGEWKWENLVTACAKCNSRKGQKTLEEANMKLVKVPKAPKEYDILTIPLTTAAIKMLRMKKGTPEEWHQYLAKPSSEP
ncbi:PREDICTED: uncharacterized protein LOC104597692 [Nelumbo nucifera]|uniref:Uncharacterized protein LOC104597692 n=2 Tax=Nelumbo nucifera TaxID=4432 RepID=A0A1U8A873_NELNU|nr:PREDICTED: uncharacterized protein LOC104597692 [Nelumbo nucifera]DAD42058.1 TPA_asm: hypothetical protein HUJ06_000288 [Nelumbo nucifera]